MWEEDRDKRSGSPSFCDEWGFLQRVNFSLR